MAMERHLFWYCSCTEEHNEAILATVCLLKGTACVGGLGVKYVIDNQPIGINIARI